jgi:hypothetical protein
MTKSARGIVVASFVVACLPLAAGTLQDPDVVLVSEGIIDVRTATDGREVVVSVDTASPAHPADGIVDRAFRVQVDPPIAPLSFRGPGQLTYRPSRLAVVSGDELGWVFSVAGRDAANSTPGLGAYPRLWVAGLSHHWGPAVRVAPELVATALFSRGCAADASNPECSQCTAGGPGVQGCLITCETGGDCSASCGDGYFACCSCQYGCRCCKADAFVGGLTLAAPR